MPFVPVEIIERWDGGANSKDFPENIGQNQSPNPRNIQFIGKSIGKAPGFTVFGTESEAITGFTLYNHKLPVDRDQVMVKTVNDRIKFYDETTATWQLLSDATFTVGERWSFWSFNGYMYGTSPNYGFIRWKGSAWGKTSTPILAGASSIPLGTGEGARFSASGNGIIEGDTFSWSGVSTDTLTGVTGLVSNHAAGVRTITALDPSTYSGNPKGTDGEFFKNRSFVVQSASPNIISFSKLADNTNPQDDIADFTIAGSGAGDAGFIVAPGNVTAIIRFIASDNNTILVALVDDGVVYNVNVLDTGGATVGTMLPIKEITASLVANKAVVALENELICIDDLNDMRSISYSSETNSVLRTTRLSDQIQPSLADIDFSSDGVLVYAQRKVIALGKQHDASVNNFALIKDTNPDAFCFYDHWAFNGIVKNKTDFYGLSSVNANVYKLFDGLNAGGDDLIITSQYPTRQMNFGSPLILKQLRHIRVSGFMTTNCILKFRIFLDGMVVPIEEFILAGDNTDIVSAITGVSWGEVVWGSSIWGGGSAGGVQLKRFYATLSLSNLQNFYTAQVLIVNEQADVDFRMDKMMFFAELEQPELDNTNRYISGE